MTESSGIPDRPTPTPDHEIRPSHVVSVETATWSGPLPTPSDFRDYDETLPGAADRILQMAEQQQDHRHNIESGAFATADKIVAGDSRRSYLGIILAFIIAMTGLLGGIFLIYAGRGGYGLTLGLSSLVGLVSIFVYGTRSRRAERFRNVSAADPE